jgi:hypothetical protein
MAWKDNVDRLEGRCSSPAPAMFIVTTRKPSDDDHRLCTLGSAMFQTMLSNLPRVPQALFSSKTSVFDAKKSVVHRLPGRFSKLCHVARITMNIARPSKEDRCSTRGQSATQALIRGLHGREVLASAPRIHALLTSKAPRRANEILGSRV